MSYLNTFRRKEIKFLLDKEKYEMLLKEMQPYMTADEYGVNTILNIYLDNESNDVIRNSLDKPVYREKLRLRAYGTVNDDSCAFLEIKKKFKGVVYKRRLNLTYKELHDYVTENKTPQLADKDKQCFEEIKYFIGRLDLKPEIVICYDRQAFYGNDDKEFRITFDGNVRSRRTQLDLRCGDFGELLSNQPYRIMEIKSIGAVPMWLTKILSEHKIYMGSFSKYGNIYLNEMYDRKDKSDIKCFQA